MRLIDIDALENRLYESQANNTVKNVMYKMIRTAPTVDAVPVVRCRECKYYDMIDRDDVVKACLYWKSFMSKDGYCSIGERREDGDTSES